MRSKRYIPPLVCGAVLLGLLILTGCSGSNQSVRLSEDVPSPFVTPAVIDPDAIDAGTDLMAMQTGRQAPVLVQRAPDIFQEGRDGYCALLPAGLSPGQYALEVSDAEPAFSWVEEDGALHLREGRAPVLTYNHDLQLKEGVQAQYRRSTYVHPVWNLNGQALTDDFPEDHYHHRGLSWMWPRVVVGAEEYDLWHLQGIRHRFDGWLGREAGPVCATLGVENSWQLDDGTDVMSEQVWLRVFRAGDEARAVDVRLTLEAAGEPVQLLGQENQDKGYGGLSFRFAPRQETVITTPEGIQDEDSDHQYVPWADESGRFGDGSSYSGVAIFQHPSNPGFPAAWTLRHYGFLGVAWPGNKGTILRPGEPVTLRYRLWIHDGQASQSELDAAFDNFVDPPRFGRQ